MAENKDLYKLGQSEEGSIVDIGQEIRIDLQLEDNIISDSGTVFGKVLDVNGEPIEGVTIKLTDGDFNPKYHTVTATSGLYTIDEVDANKQYLILAVKDSYDLKQGLPFIMQSQQQIERDFVMTISPQANNCLVAGDILNNEGKKLEGVTIRLYDNSESEPVLLKTTHTNQFGQYAFFDIPQGMYLITGSLLGYHTSETTFIIESTDKVRNINLTINIDPISKRGTINGIIKDKNNMPIPGAFVILFEVTTDEQGKEKLIPIRKTITNDYGLYLFEQIPEGNYKIKANKLVPNS
ncbi:MSCRAMM family protein [Tepidibacter hydrothermalis]|uniref:Carboxypeptidase-like regulatory domain-containing protein n=1 Tax=Tepidibacter hydrothermalis TaxID=3036126 RepID=A0ABY8EDP1_9FIRM|nr:carboxypeptidase-like regulatory domain-containing protein [Tepidibacter hydrothermalis]WFD10891.1 carboxypeptidase-like regulatory domain-containing protein [Tepidibacter hydrothermalis]